MGSTDWSLTAGSSTWNKLFDRYYRKKELYTMEWGNDVDLNKMICAGSRYAGPIALIRDEKKVSIIGAGSLRPTLNIYSCSGALLASIPWKVGRLVEMGWTEDERLVCVVDDGTVFVYSVLGRMVQSFTMGAECKDERVRFCCIWGGGLACLTHENSLVYVDDLEEPVARKMPRIPETFGTPLCMSIIEPSMTASKGLEVLIAVDKTVLVMDLAGVTDQKLTTGPVKAMTVCPNGKMLACFTHDGLVSVITTDFTKNLSDFPTKSQIPPNQLVWCGTDSVVLYWGKLLLMVGPFGDWVKYAYEEALCLIPERDSVRIVTDTKLELLQKVPEPCVEVLKLGSCTPAAMLLDAKQLLDGHDPKADDVLRSILDFLPAAITGCVLAALEETDVGLQQALLAAAAYGQALMSEGNVQQNPVSTPEDDVVHLLTRFLSGDPLKAGEISSVPPAAAPLLRVLNNLRSTEIGIPLTVGQLARLTLPALLIRLARRGLFYVALQVAGYLGLATDQIVEEWAVERLARGDDMSDEALYDLLLPKLTQHEVSLAAVAASAWRLGRGTLAKLLLNQEPKASEQVPLLISLGEDRQALVKAVESNDSDLVYLALLHLLRRHSPAELLTLVGKLPLARALLVAYMKHSDPQALAQLYIAMDQPVQAAHISLKQAYKSNDMPKRRRGLDVLAKSLAGNKHESIKALATAAKDQCVLLDAQQELEATTGRSGEFVDCSASETVKLCFRYNQHKRGLKLAKDLRLSERLLCSVRVQGLSEGQDWAELDKLSREKKIPPIGWEPFVDACWQQSRVDEALKYVQRITDYAQRAEMCMKMDRFREAATAAAAGKDIELLQSIRSRTKVPTDIAFIDNCIADVNQG